MVPKLKTFIEEHINLIEENKWQELYSYAIAKIPSQIGNLSYNLIQAGINPLNDLNKVIAYMFSNAMDLKELRLPQNITSIETSAFASCYNLKQINLPRNITFIDVSAFRDCFELDKIIYEGSTKEFLENINPTVDMFFDCPTGIINCIDGDVIIDIDGTITVENR